MEMINQENQQLEQIIYTNQIPHIEQPNQTMTLGDRMKMYENQNLPASGKVEKEEYFIIRLDGRSFSNFTSGFVKPFDKIFIKAMCYTAEDLLEKFACRTAYCHSDEITLIFTRQWPDENGNYTTTHLFDGRIQKLLSLTAAYASVRFNWYLMVLINSSDKYNISCDNSTYKKSFVEKINECEQMFDARIIIFNEQNKYEIVNHQIWRSVYDCHRNAVQSYAHHYIGHKTIHGKNTSQMIEMLKETNIKWDDVATYIKYGFYCKKELYEKQIDDNVAIRSKQSFKNFKIEFSENIF